MNFIGLDELRSLAGTYGASNYGDYLNRLVKEAEVAPVEEVGRA